MSESPDMIIRINDDDGNSLEEHRYDPRKFLTAEAIAAEKVTQLNWVQIVVGSQTGHMGALAAVLWLLRKRKDPKLQFKDVQFNTGNIEIFDPDEDERYETPEPVEADELTEAAGDPKDPA